MEKEKVLTKCCLCQEDVYALVEKDSLLFKMYNFVCCQLPYFDRDLKLKYAYCPKCKLYTRLKEEEIIKNNKLKIEEYKKKRDKLLKLNNTGGLKK